MALLSVALAGTAQDDTLTTAPWLDHEFRYWQGDPMMHGPNGECIAGYTDEERVLRFFRDGLGLVVGEHRKQRDASDQV